MKKIILSLAAVAALMMVGCKKDVPMTPVQQQNAIEEAATKLSKYVDVPNWGENYDILSEAFTCFANAEKEGSFGDLNDYFNEIRKKDKTVTQDYEITTLVLSHYNAEVVVTKTATGDYKSQLTKKNDGGIKITFPSEKYGQCVVTFQSSKELAGKVRLLYEDRENVYCLPVSAQGTIMVNGAQQALLNIKASVDSKTEYIDINKKNDGSIALEMSMTVGNYTLVLSGAEKGLTTGALSETLYFKGELVEQFAAGIDGLQLPFESEMTYGTADVMINVCNTVTLAGKTNVDEFIPLAMEFDAKFNDGYPTKDEADAFAKKMTDALALNVFYYNNMNYVQANVEFASFADKDDAEGSDIFVVRPVIVFADGSRNTFEEFFTPDFIDRITNIVMPVIERIKEKISSGEID